MVRFSSGFISLPPYIFDTIRFLSLFIYFKRDETKISLSRQRHCLFIEAKKVKTHLTLKHDNDFHF